VRVDDKLRVVDAGDVRGLVRKYLREYADCSGSVLYSGLDTLTAADFYFIGLNPGDSSGEDRLIDHTIHPANWSAYTCQCWQRGCNEDDCAHKSGGKVLERYATRHQRRVQQLARSLGQSPEQIFATNCIFVRSPSTRELMKDAESRKKAYELWNCCWPVHAKFLSEVKPKLVVCLGNGTEFTSFGLLHRKSNTPEILESGSTFRDGRYFKAQFNLGFDEPWIYGVPHPSWHQPPANFGDRSSPPFSSCQRS